MEWTRRAKAKFPPLLILTVVVDVLIFLSVADIYLTIPFESGMKHHKPAMRDPPAKRLIFFLVDDLKASSLYTANMSSVTPYLYSVVNERASWGVAHTQGPTESKSGYVSFLSGMYISPTSIVKSWIGVAPKFDTVLNQSKRSAIFGTSGFIDSLNIYYCNHVKFYPHDELIFEEKYLVGTQQWAFMKARQYLDISKKNSTFPTNGTIILLHLTAKNTLSAQLKKTTTFNMSLIDKEIRAFEEFLKGHYKDERTAYILTSNLELTNWGFAAFESGKKKEIPIIVWGAGVTKSALRKDINSTSIAPLISALLGIYFPIHSMGIVPLDYLDVKRKDAAHIITANALQLIETFLTKEEKVTSSPFTLKFKSYIEMSHRRYIYWRSVISNILKTCRYEDVIVSTSDIIEKTIEGINYYNNYFKKLKLQRAGLAYLAATGWLLYIVSWLPIFSSAYIREAGNSDWNKLREKPMSFVYFATNCSCLSISYFFGLTYYYALYIHFPMTTWYLVYNRLSNLWLLYLWLSQLNFSKLLKSIAIYTGGIHLLIHSFLVGRSLTPVVFGNLLYIYNRTKQYPVSALWFFVGCLLCSFTLLPVAKTQDSLLFLPISFFLFSYIINYLICYPQNSNAGFNFSLLLRFPTLLQISMSMLAHLNVITVRFLLKLKVEPYIFNYSISWLVLGSAVILPFLSPRTVIYRVVHIVVALVQVYVLLCGGLDSIFIVIYSFFLLLWVLVEQHITNQKRNVWFISFSNNAPLYFPYFKEDLRKALTFITFVFVGLFGIDDLSTLGSYDEALAAAFIPNTYHRITFCLYLLKMFIPLLIAMCCFLSIVKITNTDLTHCLTLVIIICHALVIQFFSALKNDNSWEQISVELTKFIVTAIIAVAVILSYFVSRVFTFISAGYIVKLIKRRINF